MMTKLTTMLLGLAVIAATAACGGKKGATTPDESGITIDNTTTGDTTDRSGSMHSLEKLDEINRLLERKRPAVSRCLTMVVDNQDLPKNARGRVTLAIVISQQGRADSVKVIKASLDSQPLNECVMNKVREIQFPQLVKPYETSYTYAFEAIQ